MIIVYDMFSFQEQIAASEMLDELLKRRLVVVKVKRDDVTIRSATETNPEWYQVFCGEYMKRRKKYPKLRTYIKRCWTIKALTDIANDSNKMTIYIQRLLPYVVDYLNSSL